LYKLIVKIFLSKTGNSLFFMGKSALCQQTPDPGVTDSEEWCNVRALRLHWFTWKAVLCQVYEEIRLNNK